MFFIHFCISFEKDPKRKMSKLNEICEIVTKLIAVGYQSIRIYVSSVYTHKGEKNVCFMKIHHSRNLYRSLSCSFFFFLFFTTSTWIWKRTLRRGANPGVLHFIAFTIHYVPHYCINYVRYVYVGIALEYGVFNGELPVSRMHACGKGSCRAIARVTDRRVSHRGNEKSFSLRRAAAAVQRPISIGGPFPRPRRNSDCSPASEGTLAVSRIRPLPLPPRARARSPGFLRKREAPLFY